MADRCQTLVCQFRPAAAESVSDTVASGESLAPPAASAAWQTGVRHSSASWGIPSPPPPGGNHRSAQKGVRHPAVADRCQTLVCQFRPGGHPADWLRAGAPTPRSALTRCSSPDNGRLRPNRRSIFRKEIGLLPWPSRRGLLPSRARTDGPAGPGSCRVPIGAPGSWSRAPIRPRPARPFPGGGISSPVKIPVGIPVFVAAAGIDPKFARLVHKYLVSACVWLLLGSLAGLTESFRFSDPDLFLARWLSFGRLRPVHTGMVLFGWASLALVGIALYVVPRSCRTNLYSLKLARLALWFWNVGLSLGVLALCAGQNNGGQEYREFPLFFHLGPVPLPVVPLLAASAVMHSWNFYQTIAKRTVQQIYISNWFILGALPARLVHRGHGLHPRLQQGDRAAGRAGLVHAQHGRHVVHAARRRRDVLHAAEAAQQADLLVRARRARLLDAPDLLHVDRDPPLHLQPASAVAADRLDHLLRRDDGARLGEHGELPADDARRALRDQDLVLAALPRRRRGRRTASRRPRARPSRSARRTRRGTSPTTRSATATSRSSGSSPSSRGARSTASSRA